ncbi:hypothetical protein HPG69_012875 [Diceros bicornis minor]|uniref:Uncharacterized protein n=1 Tax=Diceros bicornis minor TaxID=77932 RepID=A0A7J7F1N7_DICBM|nr:hypothetical protein HPG69_012875 [Diceros bicornis minor]
MEMTTITCEAEDSEFERVLRKVAQLLRGPSTMMEFLALAMIRGTQTLKGRVYESYAKATERGDISQIMMTLLWFQTSECVLIFISILVDPSSGSLKMANHTSTEDDYDVLIEDDLKNNEIEQCNQYDNKILSTQLVPPLYTMVFILGLLDNLLAVLILHTGRKGEVLNFVNLRCTPCYIDTLVYCNMIANVTVKSRWGVVMDEEVAWRQIAANAGAGTPQRGVTLMPVREVRRVGLTTSGKLEHHRAVAFPSKVTPHCWGGGLQVCLLVLPHWSGHRQQLRVHAAPMLPSTQALAPRPPQQRCPCSRAAPGPHLVQWCDGHQRCAPRASPGTGPARQAKAEPTLKEWMEGDTSFLTRGQIHMD